MADETIRGGRALAEALSTLAPKLEKNVMRSALRAGINQIRDAARANVPVAPPNAKNVRLYGAFAGALRKSIKVKTNSKGGRVTAKLLAGDKIAYYAAWVEFGTKPHSIKKGARRASGKYQDGKLHPGGEPRPFMRPAMDSKTPAAVQAVANKVRERLTKEGINVPAPEEV